MEISTPGFIGIHRFENGATTRGAILITAMDTKPLEFRVTAPVSPNSLQSTLYGELLNEHIAVDLLGMPLLNAVEHKPDLILVSDNVLLGINSRQAIPTIRIIKADEPLMNMRSEPQILKPLDSSHQAAKIYTSEKFLESLETITEQLQVVFSQRDLMEPFERIEKACIDAHSRKVGDK